MNIYNIVIIVIISKNILVCEWTTFIHIDEYYLVGKVITEGKLIIILNSHK